MSADEEWTRRVRDQPGGQYTADEVVGSEEDMFDCFCRGNGVQWGICLQYKQIGKNVVWKSSKKYNFAPQQQQFDCADI